MASGRLSIDIDAVRKRAEAHHIADGIESDG